jgi:integrase
MMTPTGEWGLRDARGAIDDLTGQAQLSSPGNSLLRFSDEAGEVFLSYRAKTLANKSLIDKYSGMTHDTITVKGREFPLYKEPSTGYWRVRKRTRDVSINKSTRISDLAEARKWARVFIERELNNSYRLATGGHTLEEVAAAYLSFPKAAREYVAEANVARLRTVVREALGKELCEVRVKDIGPRLWEQYAASRHGGRLDLSTPRRENIGIMSALRSAASVFARKLDRRYKDAGIFLDFANMRELPFLPVLHVHRQPVSADAIQSLTMAWKSLRQDNPLLYTTIGLALHAGLRASEIAAARRNWVETDGSAVRVILRDRPEEGFRTKGKVDSSAWVSGLVLDIEFAAHLLSLPDGLLVPVEGSKAWFFKTIVNQWVRQFIPRELDGKGLHRLRGLYGDAVKSRFEAQILARTASIDAARLALGHTSAAITLRNYLTPDAASTTPGNLG